MDSYVYYNTYFVKLTDLSKIILKSDKCNIYKKY